MPLFHEAVDQRCQKLGTIQNVYLFVKSLKAFTNIDIFDVKIFEKQLVQIPHSIQNILEANGIPGVPAPYSSECTLAVFEAVNLIRQTSPQSYISWDTHIEGIMQISGGDFYGASHPHIMSMILLGDKFYQASIMDRALSLVHEMGHQELFLINTMDRLVQRGFEYNMLHAPFQGKERPPIGRLHSLFALFRMVQFERENGIFQTNNHDLLRANLESFCGDELTPFGAKAVESIRLWASN